MVKSIVEKIGPRHLIVSADHYFLDVDGHYRYDGKQIGKAHQACFGQFMMALVSNVVDGIVVDNTNTTAEEISPYVLAGQSFGWTVEVLTVHVGRDQLPLCAARCRHNVPLTVIEQQWERIQRRTLPAYWTTADILVP